MSTIEGENRSCDGDVIGMVANSNNPLSRAVALGTVLESGAHSPLRVRVNFYGAEKGYNIFYWRQGTLWTLSILDKGWFTAQSEADVWDLFRRKGWTIIWDDAASSAEHNRSTQRGPAVRKAFVWAFLSCECLFGVILAYAMISNSTPHRWDWFVAVLPALMLADYYGTLLNAWRVKRIWPTADLAALELNAMWKADVARLRLFNFRQLIHVAFYAVFFTFLSQAPGGPPRNFYLFLLGVNLGLNAMVVATHIYHLMALSRVDRGTMQVVRPGFRFDVPSVFAACVFASLFLGPYFFFGGVELLASSSNGRSEWDCKGRRTARGFGSGVFQEAEG